MKKYHNFEWKFVPQFHARRSTVDQIQLKTTAAKQKLVHTAIVTVNCEFFLDIDSPINDSGVSVRRFFLDQKLPGTQGGPSCVLAIDRAEKHDNEFIFTAAKEHHNTLSELVYFSPIHLLRTFGYDIKKQLSLQGLEALEDQYWDDQQNVPRSRFSDSLKDDHMDDRDIRIVIENLPESLLGVKRPGDTAGLDIDDITQPSFNTQGQSKAKHPRFESPRGVPTDNTFPDGNYVKHLEQDRAAQAQRIAALEAQLANMLSQSSQPLSSVSPTPGMALDDSP